MYHGARTVLWVDLRANELFVWEAEAKPYRDVPTPSKAEKAFLKYRSICGREAFKRATRSCGSSWMSSRKGPQTVPGLVCRASMGHELARCDRHGDWVFWQGR